jgi:hypothetical protein
MTRRVFLVGRICKGVRTIIRPQAPGVVSLDRYRLDRRPKDLDGRPVKGAPK